MKRHIFIVLIAIFVLFACCSCDSESKLAGSWVCDQEVNDYPNHLVLKSDGTGVCDSMSCSWYAEDGRLTLEVLIGEYTYNYHFSGSTLYLDDNSYHTPGSKSEEKTEYDSGEKDPSSDVSKQKDDSAPPVKNDEEEIIENSEYIPIEDQIIDGEIKEPNQIVQYTYHASQTGKYGLQYEFSDARVGMNIVIKDARHDVILEKKLMDKGSVNVNLNAEQDYYIDIEDNNDIELDVYQYHFEFLPPNEKIVVTDNQIHGSVRFSGQEDTYEYTAPKSGIFGFAFDSSDSRSVMEFVITDSRNKDINKCSFRYGSGITSKYLRDNAELTENETYTITLISSYEEVTEYDYSLTIGIPKDCIEIQDNTTVSDQFEYKGQENSYLFTASHTGYYDIDYKSSDEVELFYEIIDDKNGNVTIAPFAYLEEGRKYKVTMSFGYSKMIDNVQYEFKVSYIGK